MKKICLLASFVFVFSSIRAQMPSLGSLDQFAVFTSTQLSTDHQIFCEGNVGANNIINGSSFNVNGTFNISDPVYSIGAGELNNIISSLNSLSYTGITLNSSGGNVINNGNYFHNGNITLSGINSIIGTSSGDIIIKVNGDLTLDSTCGFNVLNINYDKILFYVTGNLNIKNNSIEYGTFIVLGNSSIEGDCGGRSNILCLGDIALISANGINTFYSRNSLKNQLNGLSTTKSASAGCSTVNVLGSSLNDYANDIAIDNSGNYFVTGTFSGTCSFFTPAGTTTLNCAGAKEMFICKYDDAGNIVWIKEGELTVSGDSEGRAVKYDISFGTEYIYVGGFFTGQADFNEPTIYNSSAGAAYLLKLDAITGNIIWVHQEAGSNGTIEDICIDGLGKVYAIGQGSTSDFFSNGVISNGNDWAAKFDDLTGNIIWLQQVTSASLFIHLSHINVSKNSSDDNLVISAPAVIPFSTNLSGLSISGPATGYTGCGIFNINRNTGLGLWSRSLNSSTLDAIVGDICLSNSPTSSIYVSGMAVGGLASYPVSSSSNYILELNDAGAYVTSTTFPPLGATSTPLFLPWSALAIDNLGNIYATGNTVPTTFVFGGVTYSFKGMPILKYDPSLNLQLVSEGHTASALRVSGTGIEANDCLIYVSGQFDNPISIDGITYSGPGAIDGIAFSIVNEQSTSITATGATSFCLGGSVTLDAGIHPSYQWLLNGSPIAGATSQTYLATANGIYTVQFPLGCCSTATASITVTVWDPPLTNAGPDLNACTGVPITIDASNAPNPVWTPATNLSATNVEDPVFTSSTTGVFNYTISAIDANGCTASDNVTITVFQQPTANAGPDLYFCAGDPAGVILNGVTTGAGGCNWSPSTGLSSATSCTTTAVPASTTLYTLSTTDNGCTASNDVLVTVDPGCCPAASYVYTGSYSSSAIFSSSSIYMSGTITITGSVIFNCPNMLMAPNAEIVVQPGASLIVGSSFLHPCSTEWKGITVLPGGNVDINQNSRIEGAQKAVRSVSGGNFTINNSLFNRNEYDVYIESYSGTHAGKIFNSVFTCRNLPIVYSVAAVSSLITSTQGSSTYLSSTYLPANIYTPGFGRSKASVTILNNTNVNIGITATIADLNVFDLHTYGIFATNSNFTTRNCRFDNILRTDPLIKPANGAAIYAENPGLIVSNPSTYHSITVGGNSSLQNCGFNNCYEGIITIKYNYVDIQNNNFSNNATIPTALVDAKGLYGIFNDMSIYSTYEVNNNTIANSQTGIHMNRNIKATSSILTMNINNNTVSGGSTSTLYCNTGILVEDIIPSFVGGNINITQNKMDNNGVGIHARNIAQKVNIDDNRDIDIKPTITTLPYHAGIRAEKCLLLNITNNKKIKCTGSSDIKVIGVYITNCNGTNVVTCNNVKKPGRGFVFEGDNSHDTQWENNVMENCFDGYVLWNNGRIGLQGAIGHPSDNSWVGTFGRSKTFTDFTFTPNTHSTLYMRNSPSKYYPTGSANSTLSPPGIVGLDDYNASSARLITSGPFLLCPGPKSLTLSQKQQILRNMVNGTTPFSSFETTSRWTEKFDAFKTLKQDTTLLTGDTCLQHFYTTNYSTSINKVYKMDKYFTNGDVTNANYENLSFTPIDQHELNTKRINEILIKVENGDTLISSDSTDVFSIAIQCPLDGGKAVYIARSLYNSFKAVNLVYYDNCDVDARNAESIFSNNDEDFNLFIYPNPTNNTTSIYFSGIDKEDAYILLVSIDGKIQLKQILQINCTYFEINCSSIANGTYIVNLFVSGELRAHEKLIIIK